MRERGGKGVKKAGVRVGGIVHPEQGRRRVGRNHEVLSFSTNIT